MVVLVVVVVGSSWLVIWHKSDNKRLEHNIEGCWCLVLALIEKKKRRKEEEGGKIKEENKRRVLKYENDFAAVFVTY